MRRAAPARFGVIALLVAVGCSGSAQPDVTTTVAGEVPGAAVSTTAPGATAGALDPAPDAAPADPRLTGDVQLADIVMTTHDPPPQRFDDVIAHTIRDNEDWWGESFSELYGTDYVPIAGGIYPSYPGRRDPIPGCPGPEPMTTDEIESLLALYCHSGDFFAYDDHPDGPLADFVDRYGTVVIAVILSHEWAHAIQPRAGLDLSEIPTIVSELQADCFAGAWAQRSILGESAWVQLDQRDIDAIVRFYGDVADPAAADPHVPDAHGSYLDRLGAFALGFDNGPARCVDLIDAPLALLADVVALDTDGTPSPTASTDRFVAALNEYWDGLPIRLVQPDAPQPSTTCEARRVLPGPVGVCPLERTVEYGGPIGSTTDPGGFGNAVLLANAWALLGSGAAVPDTSSSAQVRRWCAVGRWMRDSSQDNLDATQPGLAPVTAVDVDAGLRSIISVTVDIPLLVVAAAFRRGVIDQSC